MADVSHELGALRFVVESPLSSKVAMFNNQAKQHKQSQLLNPFTQADGRSSPKPTFSKDEYGKPLAGSLTEMRGQKANIHVLKEMLELCQIINSEGYEAADEPSMRVIPFGELFNIYNYISDKVVGILLRARKHKLVQFEGEMLFQRRDDDVPVFLLKPIKEIRAELESKMEEIKRATSPAPLATTLLMNRSAHRQKLQESGLSVPNSRAPSKSRSPSPAQVSATAPPSVQNSKASSPVLMDRKLEQLQSAGTMPLNSAVPSLMEQLQSVEATLPNSAVPSIGSAVEELLEKPTCINLLDKPVFETEQKEVPSTKGSSMDAAIVPNLTPEAAPTPIDSSTPVALLEPLQTESGIENAAQEQTLDDSLKTDVNNNASVAATAVTASPAVVATAELPTVVVETTAVYLRTAAMTESTDNLPPSKSDSSNKDLAA